ncbi:20080_t:CDS:2 [Gigaspora margarita]|uniref:20080_t:CDS:1 n=1 Tax=Gigaspora margarita TaxID=4874 RepID=A0ABN7UXK0_GIGMA|nr:20080_t:CDS:2 [Gigaspora margarita]
MSQTNEDITLTGNRQLLYYNNTTTTQTTPSDTTHPIYFTLEPSQPLKIITHNVQGLGVNIKFQQWLEYYNEQKAHIISMTETKWPESSTPHISLTNPLYKIYTANCDTKTAIQRESSDFNNNINNKKLPTKHLLNKLQESGLTSLLDLNNIEEHTWSRDNSRSQIDDIWTSYSILLDISEPKLLTSDESTKSDHKILSIK